MNVKKLNEHKKILMFFRSLKMVILQGCDIGPYEELLKEFEEQVKIENSGLEPNFIEYKDLYRYIEKINLETYGVEKGERANNRHSISENRLSYLVTNYVTGEIYFVCFFDSFERDILTDDMIPITNRIQSVSDSINNYKEDSNGLSFQDSIMKVILITENKINSFPKERLTSIKQITVMSETAIMCEPYNNIFQSQFKEPSKATSDEFINIPRSKLPSSSNDPIAAYLRMNSFVEVIRNEEGDSVDMSVYYKYFI